MQGEELQGLFDDYKLDSRFDHLRKEGINFVPGTGPMSPVVMLVGEAPGRMENAKSAPFIGKAGNILNRILHNVGIDPVDVYTTNVVKYWPKTDNGKTRAPTAEEVSAARGYLQDEISIVDPLLVGLCGHIALNTIFPEHSTVYKHHGKLLDGRFVPLYHPAYVAYSPDKRLVVESGYRQLKVYADEHNGINHKAG